MNSAFDKTNIPYYPFRISNTNVPYYHYPCIHPHTSSNQTKKYFQVGDQINHWLGWCYFHSSSWYIFCLCFIKATALHLNWRCLLEKINISAARLECANRLFGWNEHSDYHAYIALTLEGSLNDILEPQKKSSIDLKISLNKRCFS